MILCETCGQFRAALQASSNSSSFISNMGKSSNTKGCSSKAHRTWRSCYISLKNSDTILIFKRNERKPSSSYRKLDEQIRHTSQLTRSLSKPIYELKLSDSLCYYGLYESKAVQELNFEYSNGAIKSIESGRSESECLTFFEPRTKRAICLHMTNKRNALQWFLRIFDTISKKNSPNNQATNQTSILSVPPNENSSINMTKHMSNFLRIFVKK